MRGRLVMKIEMYPEQNLDLLLLDIQPRLISLNYHHIQQMKEQRHTQGKPKV